MSKNGLLINYEYCDGCHACEVACKTALGLEKGEFGIKINQVGPWKSQKSGRWVFDNVPAITDLCDLCADRVANGKWPKCVHHCQSLCIEYGTAEELMAKSAKMKTKHFVFFPTQK